MVSGALIGGILGLTVQLYSNAVRKLPLARHPWEHVLWTGKLTFSPFHAVSSMILAQNFHSATLPARLSYKHHANHQLLIRRMP